MLSSKRVCESRPLRALDANNSRGNHSRVRHKVGRKLGFDRFCVALLACQDSGDELPLADRVVQRIRDALRDDHSLERDILPQEHGVTQQTISEGSQFDGFTFGRVWTDSRMERAWLTANDGAARRIAEAIYEERAYDRLPVLADALEDGGCADEAILAHLRSAGPHVRGGWAVDLVLGKK